MTALFTVLVVLAVLLLIGEIRVGGSAEYRENGFSVKVKIAAFWIDVYPKAKATDEQDEVKIQETKDKNRGGRLSLFLELTPVIVDAVGTLLRRIRVDLLAIHLTWAADDPASAAMGYGAANAAMGMIYPPFEKAFKVKKSDIHIDVDFDESEPLVYGKAVATITIGQIVVLCIRYGMRVFKVWNRRRMKGTEKTTKAGKVHE